MRTRYTLGMVTTLCLAAALSGADAQQSEVPYKLGTFAIGERVFPGLVLNDAILVDLPAADPSLPPDMKTLIQRYDALSARLAALAARAGGARSRPAFVRDVSAVKILPPVLPQNMLNAALNYTEHAQEMAAAGTTIGQGKNPDAEGIRGIWERKPGDRRHNPYVFPKMVGAVIANGEPIRLPPGRAQIDWECELSIVVGRTASRVAVEQAKDYVFGYTLQNDVSDRAGRTDARYGSDWFIGKSHDTFAPLGPYIVPKQFVPDPQKLAIKFTLNGKVMQDSNTERMTHNVYEMLSYVSHVLTLQPGDIIATGSPAGVGAAKNVFMKPGDRSVCTIERIGTLMNPVQ